MTTAYSWPAGITTVSFTEAMFVWEEVRNTVTLVMVTVGRLLASSTETTSAGYVPPSAGSLGGTTVKTTAAGIPGVLGVAAEVGRNWMVVSRSAATSASIVDFLNLYCLQIAGG